MNDNNISTVDVLNVVVDLSHHNTNVNLKTARKSGILGIIHKATQGLTYKDAAYAHRKTQALEAGLMWGAYHFGTGGDPVGQAKHFLDTVNPGAHDLLVLDFEQNPGGSTMSLQEAGEFVTYVKEKTGRWPGFYSGSYIKELLGDQTNDILANCWFWLAQYGPKPVVPPNWKTWTMWQYTDGNAGPEPHAAEGIGPCDRDKFNGDLDALKAIWCR
jgi:lysozyme